LSDRESGPRRDIIVVGASAGGVEALTTLARGLPAGFPAALFVVLHMPADTPSVLPRILERAGRLPAAHPLDGAPIRAGQIYVAPPDRHLLVGEGFVRLSRGPRENSHRPAVDPLFRTAARTYGPRVIGLVLSGSGDDGTAGLMMIKRLGGLAVVQDPEDALTPGMPRSAAEFVPVDHCLPLAGISALLERLAREPAPAWPANAEGELAMPEEMETELGLTEVEASAAGRRDEPAGLSGFTCPDCGGRLWELQHQELLRFRCRVGHAYSSDSLLDAQCEALEGALWAAVNALEENASLSRRLALRATERSQSLSAGRFQARADDAERQAALIRHALSAGASRSPDDPGGNGSPAANAEVNATATSSGN
jgi:two-component system, chemotaxis family, protein-glutamate methylesterase/glutaminase